MSKKIRPMFFRMLRIRRAAEVVASEAAESVKAKKSGKSAS